VNTGSRVAWRMPSAGSLARLARVDEHLPPPGPGEARVRVEAIGLNFADVFACLGLYSATPSGAFVPGLECAGTIEALGPPRHGSHATPAPPFPARVGDRVMVLTRFGGYATALNADTRYLLPVPPEWSVAEAAAFPVQAITAWYGLVQLGALRAGHTALIHSAAGGVGLHALSIVERIGARAIATVGREEKAAFLVRTRGMPRAHVIVRDRRRFARQLDAALAALGAPGFDVVFDAVAGPYVMPALTRLRPEGRYVIFGAADFMPAGARPNWARLAWQYLTRPRLDPMRLIDRNRGVLGFNLIWLFNAAGRLPEAVAATRALVGTAPHIGARFSFDDLPRALATLQSGTTTGKVIVEVQT
jgi:synaptic vesicle membrane protein VAT-1